MTSLLAPAPLEGLRDKSVLITGGASGIGLATVQSIAAAGAYVTIADVQPPLDAGVLQKREGQHVQYVRCDVGDWASQVAAFKGAIRFSPSRSLDVVATFAAVDPMENLVDQIKATGVVSLDDDPVAPSLKAVDVNLKGSFYSAALALHYFRLQPATTPKAAASKSLIFISSLAGYIDDDHNTAYTASKFGTRGLFRAVRARAHAEMGVRVNLIAPWAVETPMTAPILSLLRDLGISEGRGMTFASKEVCAAAVARCAVDESLQGRAYAIVPEGAYDLRDDLSGAYGGEELKLLMAWRKEAGDFLQG